MSVVLKMVSSDKLMEQLNNEKIIINYIDIFAEGNKEKIDNYIFENYSEDNLSVIPQCHPNCGELKGAYYVGETCPNCGTVVESKIEDNIKFLLWMKNPEGVRKFISPVLLMILMERYKVTRPALSLIEYLILPGYKFKAKRQRTNIEKIDRLNVLLERNGIKRGYNSFIDNFQTIIEILEAEFVTDTVTNKEKFKKFVYENMAASFNEYLPFPNKIIFTMDSNQLGRFIDKTLLLPINVIRRMSGIDLYTNTLTKRENKTATSLIDLAKFYRKYMHSAFFMKPGITRQHISSTRSHFTARTVITSIKTPHRYDEIHLPWSIACTLFRYNILNALYKKGYSYKEAVNFLGYHNKLYTPILNTIFNEMIEDAKGIKILLNRNPSLHKGSIQSVVVTKIKTDVHDRTVSMSDLIAKAFNADFDGDALNLQLQHTKNLMELSDTFKPHNNILGLNGNNEFSDNIAFPKTIISTLANWYNT